MVTQQRGRRRPLLAGTALAGVGIVALTWGFLELQPFRHHAVSFQPAQSCKPGDDGSRVAGSSSAFTQKWENGELVVRASETSYCGAIHSVSAQVVAGHVFMRLKYGEPGRAPAACLCRHETIVRLKGVDNRSYSIHRVGFARLGG